MKNVDQFRKELDEVEKEIGILSSFRKTPEQQKFLRQLQGRRSFLLRLIQQKESTSTKIERVNDAKRQKANINRSEKNKRNWRYAKAIAANYGIPVQKVRSELKKRKKGFDSDISDVVWRNPSP